MSWKKSFTLMLLAVLVLVSSLGHVTATTQSSAIEVDPELQTLLQDSLDSVLHTVVVTYYDTPTEKDLSSLTSIGLNTYVFEELPMVAVQGTKLQIESLFNLTNIRSIYADKELEYYTNESVSYIGADQVWEDPKLGYTGEDVTVAVIDSGIDAMHPDLTLAEKTIQNVKILADIDPFGDGSLYAEDVPNTDTTSGHGTHVAGTIAGTGEASEGTYRGVAPDANLVGLGTGEAISILFALQAFDYVLKHQETYDIKVISNSWGTTGEYTPNNPINIASKEAYDAGMTVVFASGNEGPGDNTLNPYSVAPWVIGVAAGDKEGQLASFSSRGVEGDELLHPTITAPGVDIVAAKSSTGLVMNSLGLVTDIQVIAPGHLPYYTTASGTSMATPHVSGVIALMLDANPDLHPDIVKQILVDTATPMPDYSEHEVGAGYVNAYDAVTRASRAGNQKGKYKDNEKEKEYDTYTVSYEWEGTIGPGVAEIDEESHDEYLFDIDGEAVNVTVEIDWGLAVNDLDLYVYDPEGGLAGSSGQFATTSEKVNISHPETGEWTVDVTGWLNTVESYTGTYTVEYIVN
ncbi:S8 family serine peptidase [Caldalkalibacillus salinus]|uniref:S8 family serine peptidase n=1 Tax=Caldalkalibacillus salinus TaxID=2803787 RepID=UPI0019219A01|nr:S8 family serine peptidase [Caldalkalibacillus salinus]